MLNRPAIFLDKDGTVIEDVPYNIDPALIRLTKRAAEGLKMLHASGYLLFVITNQSGVARGLFVEGQLVEVERRLNDLLAEAGVPLAGFYYCPHHPEGTIPAYTIQCSCRKPGPELIMRAANKHCLDLARSWFIGDTLSDVEAGRRAGCRTVLLSNEPEITQGVPLLRTPHYIVPDLAQAARVITELPSAVKD